MKITKDEELIIKLNDCFTAGYTLPQFCIDNKITRPLIVTEEKFWQFAWQIYVQFCYDKRLTAQFSFIDNSEFKVNYSVRDTIRSLKTKPLSEQLINDCDKIIVLSTDKSKITSDKAIYLNKIIDDFIRKVYYEIPVLHFLQRYPKVKLIVTKFPSQIKQYEGGAEFEKALPTTGGLRNILRADQSGKAKTQLDKLGYTNEEVLEMVEVPKIKKNSDGTSPLRDTTGKFLHPIKDGRHITVDQPEIYENKIYFVGSCHYYGINAPYDKTIESYLQKMLNEANLPYRVENCGQHYWGRHQDTFYNMNTLKPIANDIIFLWVSNPLPKNLPILDLSDAFAPPHDYKEIFVEKEHGNEIGYKILSEKYFEFLTKNNFFRDTEFNYPLPPPPYHRYGIPPQFEKN